MSEVVGSAGRTDEEMVALGYHRIPDTDGTGDGIVFKDCWVMKGEPSNTRDSRPPPAIEGEMFGFWYRGIWQPVLPGTTVVAMPGNVRFIFPFPGRATCGVLDEDGRACVLPNGHDMHQASVPGGFSHWRSDYDPTGYSDDDDEDDDDDV